MSNTTRLSIPKLVPTDPPRSDIHVNAALDDIDNKMAYDMQGTIGSRPTAGVRGRFYTATDQSNTVYRDTGSTWVTIYDPAIATMRTEYNTELAVPKPFLRTVYGNGLRIYPLADRTGSTTTNQIDFPGDYGGQYLGASFLDDPYNPVRNHLTTLPAGAYSMPVNQTEYDAAYQITGHLFQVRLRYSAYLVFAGTTNHALSSWALNNVEIRSSNKTVLATFNLSQTGLSLTQPTLPSQMYPTPSMDLPFALTTFSAPSYTSWTTVNSGSNLSNFIYPYSGFSVTMTGTTANTTNMGVWVMAEYRHIPS
jgi:hypothetical protein